MALGIGDAQEIAVGVVGKGGGAVDRVRELRDAVQGIGRVQRFLPKRAGDISEPSGGIQNPLRFPIERIFDFDQVAHVVGQGRHVAEGIGDGERLALGIHRNRGRLAQGLGNGREIALAS